MRGLLRATWLAWLLGCIACSGTLRHDAAPTEPPALRLQAYVLALSQDSRRGFDLLSERSRHFVQDVRQASLYASATEVANMPRFLRLLIGLSRQQLTADELSAKSLDEYYVFLLNQPVLKPLLATYSFQLALGPLLQSSDQLIAAQIQVAGQNSPYSLEFRLEQGQWQLNLEPLWYMTDLALDALYARQSLTEPVLGGDILNALLQSGGLPASYLEPLLEWPTTQPRIDYFWLFYANQLRFNQILYYNAQLSVLDFLNPQVPSLYQALGQAYSLVGDSQGAIASLVQSLLLEPKLARSYHYLALELMFAGRDIEAEAYLQKGALLSSNQIETFRGRGYLAFQRGDFGAAAEAFRSLLIEQPQSAYGALWLYLSERKAGVSKAAAQLVLVDYLQKSRQGSWPEPVLELFNDELSDQGVLLLAQDKDPRTDREQLCEAYFYLGFHAWLQGEQQLARDYLLAARASRVYGFVEYGLAELLLKWID